MDELRAELHSPKRTKATLRALYDKLPTLTFFDPACGRGVGGEGAMLNGQPVAAIHADLTSPSSSIGALDLTQAKPLLENAGISFIGTQKNGPFDISGDLARQWLRLPNPNGRPNSDVLRLSLIHL